MKTSTSITSLPPSPTDERHARMVKYSIAMGIRMVCIVCLLFVQGWWLLFFALGAIVLPYVAVVLANVGGVGEGGVVQRPGGIVRYEQHADGTRSATVPPADGVFTEDRSAPGTAGGGSGSSASPTDDEAHSKGSDGPGGPQ